MAQLPATKCFSLFICLCLALMMMGPLLTSAATCPEDPSPCTCLTEENGSRLVFDCSSVETAAEAKEALAKATVDNTAVVEFVATNCSWPSLPDDFFSGHSVDKLDIHDCELETVSEAAIRSTAAKLKDIRLMSNKLASFPFDLEMANLDTLILYDNRFERFPKLSYPNLRLLFLGGNLFEELPEDAFRSVPELQDLYLGGNVLKTLPANIFTPLKNLRILACESGYLNTLEANSLAFAQEATVDYLILHYNELSSIDPNALTPDRYPREKFLLNNNNLTTVPQALFVQLFQAFTAAGKGSISIAENPLICCQLLWLFRDRRVFKWFEDMDTTTCVYNEEPIKFEDVKYRKLRADCARQRRRPAARRGGARTSTPEPDDAEE